jgi:hypothetical protein
MITVHRCGNPDGERAAAKGGKTAKIGRKKAIGNWAEVRKKGT